MEPPPSLLKPRKICETCKAPLEAHSNYFLHPEIPCSGIRDGIRIDAEVENEIIYEKFLKIYGKPSINDYERIAMLEEEIRICSEELSATTAAMNGIKKDFNTLLSNLQRKDELLNHPVIKFLVRLLRL